MASNLQDVDIASLIYPAIDWSRCVIAGSYAMHQYQRVAQLRRGPVWFPNDIDVLCDIRNHELFQAEVGRVQQRLTHITGEEPVVEKMKLLTLKERAQNVHVADSGREERFHASIHATCTIRVPGLPIPMQMVALETAVSGGLVPHLAEITDLPASVNYRVNNAIFCNEMRIFHVPERALDALRTGRVRKDDICPLRVDKYKARGFDFY